MFLTCLLQHHKSVLLLCFQLFVLLCGLLELIHQAYGRWRIRFDVLLRWNLLRHSESLTIVWWRRVLVEVLIFTIHVKILRWLRPLLHLWLWVVLDTHLLKKLVRSQRRIIGAIVTKLVLWSSVGPGDRRLHSCLFEPHFLWIVSLISSVNCGCIHGVIRIDARRYELPVALMGVHGLILRGWVQVHFLDVILWPHYWLELFISSILGTREGQWLIHLN